MSHVVCNRSYMNCMENSIKLDYKNGNKPALLTQSLKRYPHGIAGKAGPFPIIQVYIFFYCGWISTWSVLSNYVKALHLPIHPQASGRIGPALLHRVEPYLLPGVHTVRQSFRLCVITLNNYSVTQPFSWYFEKAWCMRNAPAF
jgi:hypothetical protein